MKRTIKLTETELKNLIKESVNNILKEAYETVQWQHFNNGPTDKEMFNDAIEAIEMSDGQIDFDEWYPAFQDYIDYDEAEEIWVRALKHCGYSGMLYNESKLKQIVAESVKKVLREGKTINNKSFFSRGGRNMRPGKSLSGSYLEGNEFLRQKGYKNFYDAFAAVMRGELDKNTFDKWYDEHMKAVNKHNDRLEYNWSEGNDDDYDTLATSNYEDNY